ncbi:PREDICTED: uncharacterized protein LOC109463511 isoform X1 [Branchiostoma belcheri]|uniref:Uncharacterized protein LOC109463511 isoform X1 n=1 Tax=Branchiostoma belcheri TaxID=7741 RepID=A0A6P4YFX8_BRABE|nr:PREDICTED: uncharacterized protein LOC109463511 isoform X1 [Branchiostoma belcheri]
MTSTDEKKAPSSAEAALGGVFPDEIAAIKEEAKTGKRRRLKIMIIAAVIVMAALAGGAIFLGIHLTAKSVVTRSLNFWDGKQLLHETVETDNSAGTDAFYTEGSRGEAAVMYDHHKLMKAFKFSRSGTCFIIEETGNEKEGVRGVAEELEAKQDGSVQFVQNGGAMLMTVDTERPARPVLSQKLQDFCGQLEPRWAKLTPATEEEQQGDRVEIIMPAESAADETAQADDLSDHRVKRKIKFWIRRGWFGRLFVRYVICSMAPPSRPHWAPSYKYLT